MTKKILIILLLISSLFAACTSAKKAPRNVKKTSAAASSDKDDTRTKTANSSARQKNIGKNEFPLLGYYDKFYDTTVIALPPAYPETSESMQSRFSKAYRDYENENYSSSCSKFKFFAETFAPGDSLRYESLFLLSECLLLDNKVSESEKILRDLYADSDMPPTVAQKVTVRLGQVCCVLGKDDEARKLFDILKRRYPSSIYLPLANCESVKK